MLGRELENDHGWTDIEFARLFTGLSDASTGPGEAQQRIVELIDQAEGREALDSATSLDDVRTISRRCGVPSTTTWTRMGSARCGTRSPTRPWPSDPSGCSTSCWPTGLALTRTTAHSESRPRSTSSIRWATRPRPRAGLESARRTFPVREGNEAATVGLPIAVIRRVGLAAGRRLSRAGNLERPEDVFDLTVDEVTAILRSSPIVPPDPALRARSRREAREAADSREAPQTVGPASSGLLEAPDMSGFPDSIVLGTNAMVWYTTKIFGAQSSRPEGSSDGSTDVRGDAVSPGVYEGTARVVLDEAELDRIEAGDVLVCPITSPVLVDGVPRARRARLRRWRPAEPPRDHRSRVRDPGGREHGQRDDRDH